MDYLRERQPALDYTSLKGLAYYLAQRFWADLEQHHPGIDSLHLPGDVADAWKQRQRTKPQMITAAHGEKSVVMVERIGYRDCLTPVRALYLDLSQWAIEDPAGGPSGRLPARSVRKRSISANASATAKRGWTRGPGNDYRCCRCWYGPSTRRKNAVAVLQAARETQAQGNEAYSGRFRPVSRTAVRWQRRWSWRSCRVGAGSRCGGFSSSSGWR